MDDRDDHQGGEGGAASDRAGTSARDTRAADRLASAVIDAATDAILTIDAHGTIQSANPAVDRLFGYAPGQLIGRNVALLMPEPSGDDPDAYLATRRATQPTPVFGTGREVIARRKDGSTFPMHLAVSQLSADPQRLRGVVARDISELRQVEDALREANRRKDEFLAMLAHELRNPLAPIRNALHVLRLRADPATIERMRDMMERQVTQLARMVDDLLDVSRLTRGTVTLHSERVDLTRTIRVGAEDRRRLFEQARIELVVNVPGTALWILGDTTRLTQILDNLLSTALESTPAGGVVTVELRADGTPASAVLIVRDDGAGLAADLLPHVFDAFTPGDPNAERRDGLGLGLAMTHGLVELHGGRIEVHSAGPSTGTEFRVTLPLAEVDAASDATTAGFAATDRRRVLVVEDNADTADSVRMLLEMFGYDVTVTYSGQSGVEMAKRVRPHAVVCDIGLPGMDGYEVAVALRGSPETARAHLIAVTGYGQDDDRRRAFAAGFDAHLTKPVDPQALLDRLANPTPR